MIKLRSSFKRDKASLNIVELDDDAQFNSSLL